MNVNFLFGVMAVVAIVLSVVVLVSDWGDLDRAFFIGWCVVIMLFSFLVIMIALLGCMGVTHQTKRDGCWTGRRILALYQLLLAATIIGDIWLVTKLLIATRAMESTRDDLDNGDDVVGYDSFENTLAEKFNEFFFSATLTCTDSKYTFFWSWVNDHCPEEMSQENCMGCDDYSITYCPADENSCYSGDGEENNDTCAYELCRTGVLSYLISYFRPMANGILFFTAFQFFLMLLSCMLICFTEQDNVETMLVKSGTISDNKRQKKKRPEVQREV